DPLRAQVRLLALLSSAAPLNVLLGALASYVETWTEGLHCTVLLVDPTGRLLRPGAAPSLPDAYTRAIDPVPIGIGEGSCGTAAARREMVVVEDVERSDLWTKYAPIALSYGLRACWSVPIVDDAGALLGTLALRSEEHTSELQSLAYLVCRLLLEKKNVRCSGPIPRLCSESTVPCGSGR